eukprot:scaffold25830_cov101-Isochrysis_galbana.AAC.2
MQTCGTVLGSCPHINPGQRERELRNGIRTVPICPEIIASARRRPDSTFWGPSRLFLHCMGPRRPICMAYSVALAHDAPMRRRCMLYKKTCSFEMFTLPSLHTPETGRGSRGPRS